MLLSWCNLWIRSPRVGVPPDVSTVTASLKVNVASIVSFPV